jgi:hypothetical protein
MKVDPQKLVIPNPPSFSGMSARVIWETHLRMCEDPDSRDGYWTPIVVEGDTVIDGRYRVYAARILRLKEVEVNGNPHPSVHSDVSTTGGTNDNPVVHTQ